MMRFFSTTKEVSMSAMLTRKDFVFRSKLPTSQPSLKFGARFSLMSPMHAKKLSLGLLWPW